MRYVILGNSAAAVGGVEGIRQRDPQGEITLIASEPHFTYARPLISYLMEGATDEGRMRYRPADFYEKNRVTPLLGRTAVKLEEGRVLLEDGEAVPFDKLLIATGSRPFVPPVEGLEQVETKFTFMTLDDARGLMAAVDENSRVLIVGAGLIGLKCAEGLKDRVGSIRVVDMADRVMPSVLDAQAAGVVQSWLEAKGLEFSLNDSVARFEPHRAHLKSGAAVDFDVLVMAVGVRPNSELICPRGIPTDDHLRTALPNVYAAGDCTISHDSVTDTDRILALLPNAYRQGECAGRNMAGDDAVYDKAMAMNAIGFFGLHIASAGCLEGERYVEESEGQYKELTWKDDRLTGFILIGDVARAGIYTSVIREKMPLSGLDFELLKKRPQLMAFSKEYRKKVLGGAAQ